MFEFRAVFGAALLCLMFASIGCSKTNPVANNENKESADAASMGGYGDAMYTGVLGVWQIKVNKDNLDFEVIPSRNASKIGDIFDADLSQFLTVNPCANCLRISSVKLNLVNPRFNFMYANLEITFHMKHPFKNIITRPDLHGFDVRLIIIAPGYVHDYPSIMVMNPDGSEEPANLCDDFMLNPDGFTSHYDDIVTDSRYFIGGSDVEGNLNPFIRFFEDYGTTDFNPHDPSGHNVMPVGLTIDSQTAYFNFDYVTDDFVFYAVADVAYGQSAVYANRQNPQYYLPSFNRTEAWRCEYWIENNNLSESDPTSSADIVVQVFDWQQSATVDPAYPNPSNLSGIKESSNVLRVELNVPEYQDDLIISTTPEGGNGSPTSPLRYRLTVRNENMSDNNAYGLIAIRDELHGHASPSGRVPIPVSPAGFPYATQDIRDYTMYQIIRINYPRTITNPIYIYNGELLIFPNSFYANDRGLIVLANFFMDPSGSLFRYEWDLDYDGVTFDVDSTDFPLLYENLMDGGIRNIGLRITTNAVPPRVFTYTIPIYVEGGYIAGTSNLGNINTTTISRENALFLTEDYIYFAVTTDDGTKRDISLTIISNDVSGGSRVNITSSYPGTYYNPSIDVIENGPHAGIYIAFTGYDAGDNNLYIIHGTVNGTVFTPLGFNSISASPGINENNVCLWHDNTYLYAYYTKQDPTPSQGLQINVSTWDFYAPSWTFRNVIHGSREGDQNYPMIAFEGYYGSLYCVWQDGIDYSTRANDIYMSSSSNGVSFTEPVRVTKSIGLIDETYPSLAIFGRQIGVAYLYVDYAAADSTVHVAIMDAAYGTYSIHDHEIFCASNRLHTIPSIGTGCEGKFILAYGTYDTATEDLDAYILELTNEGGWTIGENLLFCEYVGKTPLSGANIYPCVRCRSGAYGAAVNDFILSRSFERGNVERPTPFSMRFGELYIVGLITDGKEWEP